MAKDHLVTLVAVLLIPNLNNISSYHPRNKLVSYIFIDVLRRTLPFTIMKI